MLVTVNDLEKYMDIKFDPAQKVGVDFILSGLQSELESHLRRPIQVGTFTDHFYLQPTTIALPAGGDWPTLYYNPFGTDPFSVPLNNTPVTEIISVYSSRVGSASVTPTLQTANRDYVIRPFGVDLLHGLSAFGAVHVTYQAGLVGEDIKVFRLLILRAAAREAQNMYDDNKGIQDLETRNATVQVTGFLDSELRSVNRYRRRRL